MPLDPAPAKSSAAAPQAIASGTLRSGCQLGLVAYALGIHRKAAGKVPGYPDVNDPASFLDAVIDLGAAGMQVPLGIRERDYISRLREEAELWGLFIEGIVTVPREESDLARFEKEIVTARELGAKVVRTVIIPGRRYEQFNSLEEFRAAVERGTRAVELAEPIARRHKVALAIENHKDHRIEERLRFLEKIGSEYVGACVDVGNNVALLEDAMVLVEAFAPWALTVHFKDQAVREYEQGFLLADIPLGKGCFDLGAMASKLKKARPGIRLHLELITRDALPVPIFGEKYWRTFPEMPARDLAATWQLVKTRSSPESFPAISPLRLEEQLAWEKRNIKQSLTWARENLPV